jgi:dipeptidyl-peptidase III
LCLMILSLVVLGCKREQDANPQESRPDGSLVGKTTKQAVQEPEVSPAENEGEKEEDEPGPITPIVRKAEEYDAGSTRGVSLVRLYADSVGGLDRRQLKLIYHLARAVLAGRDIVFDQLHYGNLEIRQLIEAIRQQNTESDPNLNVAMTRYLNLLWINTGLYDSISRQKITPEFSFDELQEAARDANATGAELGLAKDELLEDKLSRLKKLIFDPDYHGLLADPRPHQGRDILKASHLNLYRGIGIRDLANFKEAHPRNSRLVRISGRPLEQIYRAGDKTRKIAKGRYWQELGRVILRLQDAMTCARRPQRMVLTDLVEYLRTGNESAFENAQGIMASRPFAVEFYVGFGDTGLDPRGIKGLYYGFVASLDKPASSRLASLTRQIQYFEDLMPWDPASAKHWTNTPLAEAVDLIVLAGRAAPLTSHSSEILSAADGKRIKVLLFTNVIEAERQAVFQRLAREFVPPAALDDVLAGLSDMAFTQAALKEVIGKWIGKTDRRAQKRLAANYETFLELKSELVSLWLLADPKLVELGLLAGDKQVRAYYDFNAAALTVDAALISDREILDTGLLARRMIARYLVEKAKAIGFAQKDGVTYPVVQDWRKLRKDSAKLLVKCESILASGNRQAALRLLASYAGPPEWKHIEEWTQRAAKIGLRRRHAFVMPKLRPSFDSTHRVTDVSILFDEGFDQQMMRYRSY